MRLRHGAEQHRFKAQGKGTKPLSSVWPSIKNRVHQVLILTRKLGETIAIGHDIKVTLLTINGNQARIGIEAPRDVPVHREEIYERISNEQSQSARRVATVHPVR